MKSDREMMQALLAGDTLVSKEGDEWYLYENKMVSPVRYSVYPYYNLIEIKPKTININGFEVPEPLYELPTDKLIYVVNLRENFIVASSDNLANPQQWIDLGLAHSTEESATKHREALLSFIKVNK